MGIWLIIFFSILIPFSKDTECACDPAADLTVSLLVKSDLVFKGQLLEKRTEYFTGIGYRRMAVFQVNELVRGEWTESTVEIGYEFVGPCTVDFHPNDEYLVFGKVMAGNSWFSTGYCSGNRRIRDFGKKDQLLLEKYQGNKPDSLWKSNFETTKGKMLKGNPEGLWEFSNSFQLTEKGTFKNGKRSGDWVEFSTVSSVCLALGFSSLTCNLSSFHPPHPEGWISKLTPYQNGLIHGTVLTYHPSGCIESEATYHQGKLIGSIREY